MKFFLDTANLETITSWNGTGIIDGVTTNPTLLSKEGSDPKELILKICDTVKQGQISVEVTEQAPNAIYQQAKEIAALSNNIVVKIPCNVDYYATMKKLCTEGVKINATLVFSLPQALAAAKLGATYISPFIGRCDDIGIDGIVLLEEICVAVRGYEFGSEVLAASLRSVAHLHAAIDAGTDIATVPVTVLQKALAHPLLTAGMAQFNSDWQKLGIKQFP